ncbi:MAG: hypothetical protein EPO51_20590 [Phenylobacterium sp.]|uniref:hypothetical protein n=1 Tax=Phenylobacterium sp. TaxID=1871053 RepID=UPI00121ED578|nr:hypothetical protein [Phenylobacterium sp.]TAJ69922.1 MAG: hypothetical protein EPO51_20590 [Phenylobacterium sp.]
MSDKSVDPSEYAAAKDGVLELILQEADKRVSAQVQLMLAADSRASGILSGCTTLAAAGIGFAVSQIAQRPPVFWASLTFGLVEAVAAILALSALWPTEIRPQGWAPAIFATDLNKEKPRVQAEIAKFLQDRIAQNRASADKLSGRVKAAMLFASLGPFTGLAAALWAIRYDGWAVAVTGLAVVALVWLGVPLIPGAAKVRR